MLRIIYSLYVDFGRDACGVRTAIVVPLDRHGMAAPRRAGSRKDGMPRPPKRRTIDLRAGDYILHRGQWRKVESVTAFRAAWLREAESLRAAEGYVYRPR